MTEYIKRETAIDIIKKHWMRNDGDAACQASIDELRICDPAAVIDQITFCDQLREWMTKKADPMSLDTTEQDMARAYIDTWWYVDHYCKREPPAWTEGKT